MREIKFRAWDKKRKEMVYVGGKGHIIFNPTGFGEDIPYYFLPATNEVMQYTGLKDKNGVEIYEGDKVRLTVEDDDNTWVEVVKWSDEMLAWGLYDDKDDEQPLELLSDQAGSDALEVIGNIYETPELLQEVK